MKITKLQLNSFRNYASKELEFDTSKPTILITGENGKGKTNILEAVYLLSVGKTFRGAHQEDLIKWGMDYFTVKGEIQKRDSEDQQVMGVGFSTYPRKIKTFHINEVKKTHAEYLGEFITVLFHPKDLNMLYLEPGLRRKYLNLLLSQTDKYYFEALSNYTKTLKQRNALLDEISDGKRSRDDLDIWDEKIAEAGTILIQKRQELIEYFNSKIQATYRKISGGKETLEIKYKTSIKDTETYTQKLKLKRDKDVRYGTTSIGPHRDDIRFILEAKPIEEFASRGEFRTVLIALKIAEISYIKKTRKFYPVLLLDDVFSELDEQRQAHLFEAIEPCQTIITTTENPPKTLKKSKTQVVRV
jgi:DNA replication and repair protein RecF